MRHPFIHVERQTYPVRLLCAVLQVGRNGFYRFVQGGEGWSHPKTEPTLLAQVQRLHRALRRTDGSRGLINSINWEVWQAFRGKLFSFFPGVHEACPNGQIYNDPHQWGLCYLNAMKCSCISSESQ
jgi:hypothetical protein